MLSKTDATALLGQADFPGRVGGCGAYVSGGWLRKAENKA